MTIEQLFYMLIIICSIGTVGGFAFVVVWIFGGKTIREQIKKEW